MIEKITKVVNRCTCDLPDCGKKNPAGIDPVTGKPRPWDSETEEIPKRCSWCKRRNWNGPTRRQYKWTRVKKCIVCGGLDWIQTAGGEEVCAHCNPHAAPAPATDANTIKLPKPKRVRPVEKDQNDDEKA